MMLSYKVEGKSAKKALTPEWKTMSGDQGDRKQIPMDWWFEDVCMLDMDYFIRTITAIKAKGVRPAMIGAIISQYAMKWLPGLAQEQQTPANLLENHATTNEISEINENVGSESSTGMLRRNRYILETLVSILPAQKDVVPCSFLLRLLRMAHIVGADPLYKTELERRAGLQLDQASVSDLLIPSFSHTSDTVFDAELVYRIVKRFLAQDEQHRSAGEAAHSGRFLVGAKVSSSKQKVAKLLDNYLAEVAHDANLNVSTFESLAEVLPSYSRSCDDGLYRAIDTYLKAHPGIADAERRRLCRLMDCKKLTVDARNHAAQNERLPVRTVVQVLFCEQMKLRNAKTADRTMVVSSERGKLCPLHACEKEQCPSQRQSEYDIPSFLQEIQKIREDFEKLQQFCNLMQQQVDKLSKQKSSFPWTKGWKRISKSVGSQLRSSDSNNAVIRDDQSSVDQEDFSLRTPRLTQTRRKGKWRRNSLS